MVFLKSRSVSKQVLFALGVDRTARDAVKARVPTQSRKLRPSQCHARLVSVHVPSLHKSSIIKLRKASSKCCRVCH